MQSYGYHPTLLVDIPPLKHPIPEQARPFPTFRRLPVAFPVSFPLRWEGSWNLILVKNLILVNPYCSYNLCIFLFLRRWIFWR